MQSDKVHDHDDDDDDDNHHHHHDHHGNHHDYHDYNDDKGQVIVTHCCAIFLGHWVSNSKYQRKIIWLGNQLK